MNTKIIAQKDEDSDDQQSQLSSASPFIVLLAENLIFVRQDLVLLGGCFLVVFAAWFRVGVYDLAPGWVGAGEGWAVYRGEEGSRCSGLAAFCSWN